MDKSRTKFPIIGSVSVIVCLLLIIALGGAPKVEGGYATISINPNLFSASYMGENTNLLEIRLADNDGDIYSFTTTGQTILNIPENRTIIAIGAWVTIDDNYVSTINEAETRTKVTIKLTDDDAVTRFENTLGAQDYFPNNGTDNGTYYTVYHPKLSLTLLLTSGTWDLNAEYEILAIPV